MLEDFDSKRREGVLGTVSILVELQGSFEQPW